MNINVGIERIHGGKNSLSIKNKNNVLDFSLNVNPYRIPVRFLPDLSKIKDYPDFKNDEIKKTLSKKYNLPKEAFFVGNGSSEIITLIFYSFVNKGDKVFALWPSFSDYKYFTEVVGGKFTPILLNSPEFTVSLKEVSAQLQNKKPKLFFICNPVNPTGKYYGEDIIEGLLKLLTEETIVVLDEAYIDFAENKWDSIRLLKKYSNLIILKSLTKNYGLAGLRIGYSISSKKLTNYLNSAAPSWNVNTLAQEVAVKVLNDNKFVLESIIKIRLEKSRVEKILQKLGYDFVRSDVNFFLLKVKNATKARKLLLRNNILVRDCTSLGLPNYLRISINSKVENNALLEVLGSLKLYE